jgi:D-glycero-alpha-D-manno-heptose 1-phosphate guanylyltransferase
VTQVALLAGGRGTRLAGLLPAGTPKPMATVAGRPFLEHIMDFAISQGVDEFLILVGHHARAIQHHFRFRYRGANIQYSLEPRPLGTGGAILHAVEQLEEEFLLINGDTYAEVDLHALLGRLADGPLAMALTRKPDPSRFGTVVVDGGRVTAMTEKGSSTSGLINAGIYALRRELVLSFPHGQESFSLEKAVLEPRIPFLCPAYVATSDVFFDIGVPEDYRTADDYFRSRLEKSGS